MRDLMEKKKSVLDAFFSQNITKEEMRMMNEKYDADISLTAERITAAKKKQSISYSCSDIKTDVRKSVESIVNCSERQDNFYGSLLDKMVVYGDDRVEVSLNLLPTKWIYVIDSLKDIQKRTGGGREASFKYSRGGKEAHCDCSGGVVHCGPSVPMSYPQCAMGEECFDLCGVANAESGKKANVQKANFLKQIQIYEKCSRYDSQKQYGSQNQCDFILSDKPQYEVDILLAIPCGIGGDNR